MQNRILFFKSICLFPPLEKFVIEISALTLFSELCSSLVISACLFILGNAGEEIFGILTFFSSQKYWK